MEGTQVIFSQRIAIKLRERGFPIIETKVNKRYPQYDMYVFADSPEFRKEFEALSGTKLKKEIAHEYKRNERTFKERAGTNFETRRFN